MATGRKIKPGQVVKVERPEFNPSKTSQVQVKEITEIYEAVGSIRPRTETKVEAQVTGKVLKVMVKAGDAVTRGTTLIILDDRQFTTRLERAQQGLRSAKAAREEARQVVAAAEAAHTKVELQYKRIEKLFQDNVVASRELEQARADFLLTQAKMNQAEDGLEGAGDEDLHLLGGPRRPRVSQQIPIPQSRQHPGQPRRRPAPRP